MGAQVRVCMNLLETGILDWGTKEKADRRTEGQGQHPGVIRSWVRNNTQEPLQVQLGHPEVHGPGTVTPGLCPQDCVPKVSRRD